MYKKGKILCCEICSREFYVRPSRQKSKYCSVECRAKARENKKRLFCKKCGKIYFIKKSHAINSKYCSRKCNGLTKRENKTIEIRICKNCGNRFISKYKSHTFCNQKCFGENRKKKYKASNNPNWKGGLKTKLCKFCGVEFKTERNAVGTFCSTKCKSDYMIGSGNYNWLGGISFEPYPIQFNGRLKEKIRQRDEYTCQLCGNIYENKKPAVHHIDYNKNNLNENNLITLCIGCNAKVNFNRNIYKLIMIALIDVIMMKSSTKIHKEMSRIHKRKFSY